MSAKSNETRLEGDQLLLECVRCDTTAKITAEIVEPHLKAIAAQLRIYGFKARYKGANEILRKVRRLREQEELNSEGAASTYNPKKVEDPWGCRFITLFQPEIVEVVEELFDFILSHKGRELKLAIKEVLIYSNRPHSDPLSIHSLVQRAIQDVNFGQRGPEKVSVVNRDTGYSSVHLILTMPVPVDFGAGATQGEGHFEVQVRDAFEDGWGEISHKLAYKPPTRYAGGQPITDQDQIFRVARSRELNALKASADACSQHATLIDRNMTYWLDAAGLKGTGVSVSNMDEDLARILVLVPTDKTRARLTVSDAYRTMLQAHESSVRDIDNRLAREFYRTAANKFEDALIQLSDVLETPVNAPNGMPARYYLTLDCANAIVRSQPLFDPTDVSEQALISRQALKRALNLYEDLRQKAHYENDATIRLRLGQALVRSATTVQELDHAIVTLQEAHQLALNDPLLRNQPHHWLRLEALYQVAAAEYRKVSLTDQTADVTERIDRLKHAANYAQNVVDEALQFVKFDSRHVNLAHKCINNALYFITELHRFDLEIDETTRDKIKYYITMLRRRPFKTFVETHTETIDTLMRAAQMIDDSATARDMAHRNIMKLRQIARTRIGTDDPASVSSALDSDELVMYLDAMKLEFPFWTAEATRTPKNVHSPRPKQEPTSTPKIRSRAGVRGYILSWIWPFSQGNPK